MKVRDKLLVLLVLCAFCFVSLQRFHLGQIRYFDNDEFPYLNWSYHVATGSKPYIDFFFIISPLYLLFNIPFMTLLHGQESVIAVRIGAWALMVILSSLCGVLYYKWQKNLLGALLTALTLSVVPMPSDKFLEIRPDILCMCLFIAGLILFLNSYKSKSGRIFFSIGLLFSLSLLTLQKILPYIALSTLFLIARNRRQTSLIFNYFLGFAIPVALFTLWAVSTGSPDIVFYSITKLPLEVAEVFRPLLPPLTFYFMPNSLYYGHAGYSLGNVFNAGIWLTGILGGVILLTKALFRCFIPYVKLHKIHLKFEFGTLLSCMMVASLIIYALSVIRFPQYLIPSSVFVVILSSYLIMKLCRNWFRLGFLAFLTCFMTYAFMDTNLPKFSRTNTSYFQRMNAFFDKVPTTEYVLDLDGITLYYPYPYYMCCLPWPIVSYPSRTLPSLKEALAKTHTNYIYEGVTDWTRHFDRFDSDYLHKNFDQEPGKEYWIRKKLN